MKKTFDIGDTVTFAAAFRPVSIGTSTATGEIELTYPTLTDPTTVTLEVEDPSSNTATYTFAAGTVTKQTTGIYYKQVSMDEAGTWNFRWTGTGAVAASEEGQVEVRTKQTG